MLHYQRSPRPIFFGPLALPEEIQLPFTALKLHSSLLAGIKDLGFVRPTAIQAESIPAGLSGRDVAMLEYAEKVTIAASTITQADIERLREHGFSDVQISDIALCAAWRTFISRFFDAVGATPDDEYRSLDPVFRDPLVVGRPLP